MTLKMPWDPKDTFSFQVAYTKGAVAYAGQGLTTAFLQKHGTISGFPVVDAVFGDVAGSLEMPKVWSVTASFEHYWTPTLRTAITGQWIEVDHSALGSALLCNGSGVGPNGGTSRQFDRPRRHQLFGYRRHGVAARAAHDVESGGQSRYRSRSGLQQGGDQHHRQHRPAALSARARALTTYNWGDLGVWHATLRVQRNFWP